MGRRQPQGPQSGQGTLEYVGMIAVAVILVLMLLGAQTDIGGLMARSLEAVTGRAGQAAQPAPARPPQPPPRPSSSSGDSGDSGGFSFGDIVRGVADVAGFVPIAGDFVDLGVCGFEAARGDFGDAALSCTAAVPFLGTGANVIKAGRRIDDVADAVRTVDRGDDAVDAGRAACRANSFLPATPVLLADGSRRAISAVAVGDRVLATDPGTGQTGPRNVAAVIVGRGLKDLVSVTIGSGDRTVTTTATNAHPFFVTGGPGRWVDAQDLRPGDRLRTPDGHSVAVRAVRHYQARRIVHNLSVEGVPTYYAGFQPVLVHNCHVGAQGQGEQPDVHQLDDRQTTDEQGRPGDAGGRDIRGESPLGLGHGVHFATTVRRARSVPSCSPWSMPPAGTTPTPSPPCAPPLPPAGTTPTPLPPVGGRPIPIPNCVGVWGGFRAARPPVP